MMGLKSIAFYQSRDPNVLAVAHPYTCNHTPPTPHHTHTTPPTHTHEQLPLMRHDSILSFIAADTVFKKSVNYLYLISEYHPRGTLREHLVKSTLEISEALLLISSLVSGVEYLHSVLAQESRGGVVVKPSIAHCNLTSQNVYVDKSGDL